MSDGAVRRLPRIARASGYLPRARLVMMRQVKLTSRDPSPPPVEYVRGGGGIFKDMAVHDLDMSRFLMGSEPKVVARAGIYAPGPVGGGGGGGGSGRARELATRNDSQKMAIEPDMLGCRRPPCLIGCADGGLHETTTDKPGTYCSLEDEPPCRYRLLRCLPDRFG